MPRSERSRRRSARAATAERLCAPELLAQEAQGRAVELAPFCEPSAYHDVDRQRAPRCAVELDGHATAPFVAQPR